MIILTLSHFGLDDSIDAIGEAHSFDKINEQKALIWTLGLVGTID